MTMNHEAAINHLQVMAAIAERQATELRRPGASQNTREHRRNEIREAWCVEHAAELRKSAEILEGVQLLMDTGRIREFQELLEEHRTKEPKS